MHVLDFFHFARSLQRLILELGKSIILQVVFEGVRGNGIQGDIAIDDISVTPGACGSAGKRCLTIL